MRKKVQRNILCLKVNGNRESIKNLLNAVHVWPFYGKHFLAYTKRSCRIINDCFVVPLPVTQEVIPGSRKLSKDFILKVLYTLRNDELGTVCRKDEFILCIGSKLFSARSYKTEKMATVLKSVRTEMRTLAHLYRTFFSLEGVTKTYENIVDMSLRED